MVDVFTGNQPDRPCFLFPVAAVASLAAYKTNEGNPQDVVDEFSAKKNSHTGDNFSFLSSLTLKVRHKDYAIFEVAPLVAGDLVKVAIIAFVGTNDGEKLLRDVNAASTDCSFCGTFRGVHHEWKYRVHAGFCNHSKEVWKSLKQHLARYMKEGFGLIFTGHSLGGATAVLALLQARIEFPDAPIWCGQASPSPLPTPSSKPPVDESSGLPKEVSKFYELYDGLPEVFCVTFGAPFPGNAQFATLLYEIGLAGVCYHTVNQRDPVPRSVRVSAWENAYRNVLTNGFSVTLWAKSAADRAARWMEADTRSRSPCFGSYCFFNLHDKPYMWVENREDAMSLLSMDSGIMAHHGMRLYVDSVFELFDREIKSESERLHNARVRGARLELGNYSVVVKYSRPRSTDSATVADTDQRKSEVILLYDFLRRRVLVLNMMSVPRLVVLRVPTSDFVSVSSTARKPGEVSLTFSARRKDAIAVVNIPPSTMWGTITVPWHIWKPLRAACVNNKNNDRETNYQDWVWLEVGADLLPFSRAVIARPLRAVSTCCKNGGWGAYVLLECTGSNKDILRVCVFNSSTSVALKVELIFRAHHFPSNITEEMVPNTEITEVSRGKSRTPIKAFGKGDDEGCPVQGEEDHLLWPVNTPVVGFYVRVKPQQTCAVVRFRPKLVPGKILTDVGVFVDANSISEE